MKKLSKYIDLLEIIPGDVDKPLHPSDTIDHCGHLLRDKGPPISSWSMSFLITVPE